MFANDLVVSIVVDGKFLREEKGIIKLPYRTEYSIYLKNLRNEKCLIANLKIDGQDILNGNQLIINGKDSLELERFLNNDLNQGCRLKWIEKTEKISNYRGDKPEDGLISVEFQFEKKVIYNDVIYNNHYIHGYYPDIYNPIITWGTTAKGIDYSNCEITCGDNLDCNNLTFSTQGINDNIVKSCSLDLFNFNENGITTKGSISNQKFVYGNIGELESNKYIITLQLKGKNKDNISVDKVITTKEKIECNICGTKNISKNNFCSECGTYLK